MEDSRPTDQRDVVEVHNVDVESVQGFTEDLRLEIRLAGHLGGQRREDPESAFQGMNVESWRRIVRAEWMISPDRVEGVDAVEDVDLVASSAEGPREPVDVSRIAAEAMGAEERGDHAEFQRRPPVPFVYDRTLADISQRESFREGSTMPLPNIRSSPIVPVELAMLLHKNGRLEFLDFVKVPPSLLLTDAVY